MTARSQSGESPESDVGRLSRERLTAVIGDAIQREAPVSEIVDQILAIAREPSRSSAQSHPTRVAIIDALRRRGPSSPAALAEELNIAVTNLAYHFRALERFGAIELVDEVRRRGSVEHIFALCGETTGPPDRSAAGDRSAPVTALPPVQGTGGAAPTGFSMGDPDARLAADPPL